MSLTTAVQQIDRQIKGILRQTNVENLGRVEQHGCKQITRACNEIKLDVRDYEYAQSRAEQVKWALLAKHNIRVLEAHILLLGDVFGPADVALLSAQLDLLQSSLE